MSEAQPFPDPISFQPDMAGQFIADASKRSGIELPYELDDADLVVGALVGEYLESDEGKSERGQMYAEFAIELLQQPSNRRSADSRRMLARRVLGEGHRRRWVREGSDENFMIAMHHSDLYQSDLDNEAQRCYKNALDYIHSAVAGRLEALSPGIDRGRNEASFAQLRTAFHNSVVDLLDADDVTKAEAAALLLIMGNVPYSRHVRLRLLQRKAVGEMRAKLAHKRDRDNPAHALIDDLTQVNDAETASFDHAVVRHMQRTRLSYEAAAEDFLAKSTALITTLLSRGE